MVEKLQMRMRLPNREDPNSEINSEGIEVMGVRIELLGAMITQKYRFSTLGLDGYLPQYPRVSDRQCVVDRSERPGWETHLTAVDSPSPKAYEKALFQRNAAKLLRG